MAQDRPATTFVTGADGFIGAALVKVLIARGHQVFGLADSMEAAQRLRRVGAVPILGDLREPGGWEDEAATDWVFHIPPLPDTRRQLAPRHTKVARARRSVDGRLFDAVAGVATRRIVYVADACSYGATGLRPITEDDPPRPSAWQRDLLATLDRVDGYVIAGLPVVIALPGLVYGNASWFRTRIVDPIMAGRRVLQFGKTSTWVSAIHVEDCARALVHLAERGEPGRRYFLVTDEPIRMHDFADTFARLANRPLRVWRLPDAATRLLAGPALADYVLADALVLQHPPAGNRLSVPVSHSRRGTPADSQNAQ